jgi:hypothetical protein
MIRPPDFFYGRLGGRHDEITLDLSSLSFAVD